MSNRGARALPTCDRTWVVSGPQCCSWHVRDVPPQRRQSYSIIMGANEQKRHVAEALLRDDTDRACLSNLMGTCNVSESVWSSVLDSMVRSNSSMTLLHRRQTTRVL